VAYLVTFSHLLKSPHSPSSIRLSSGLSHSTPFLIAEHHLIHTRPNASPIQMTKDCCPESSESIIQELFISLIIFVYMIRNPCKSFKFSPTPSEWPFPSTPVLNLAPDAQ
jgi:hypothetical protein